MCSDTDEHSSCSENLEVVPNDELEKRRVLFEICKENYYDERGRAYTPRCKGFQLFDILLNFGECRSNAIGQATASKSPDYACSYCVLHFSNTWFDVCFSFPKSKINDYSRCIY